MKLPIDSIHFIVHDTARLFLKLSLNKFKAPLDRNYVVALAYLSRNEGINQNSFSQLLDIPPLRAARILDCLCRKGYVEKRKNSQIDQRSYFLYLLPAAFPVLLEVNKATGLAEQEILSLFTEEERLLFKDLLSRLHNRLKEVAGKTKISSKSRKSFGGING